jgi:hypothetical protein
MPVRRKLRVTKRRNVGRDPPRLERAGRPLHRPVRPADQKFPAVSSTQEEIGPSAGGMGADVVDKPYNSVLAMSEGAEDNATAAFGASGGPPP